MKRFYSEASVQAQAAGFSVLLDGKPIRTPGGRPLSLPNEALAAAIAGEWLAQAEHIRPASMPLMQLASTALDRVGPARPAVIDHLAAYGGSDLLCYRAEAPADLVERQDRLWQPVLLWAEITFGIAMVVTAGVAPVPQPPESLAKLHDVVAAHDDFHLSALHSAVAATGSLLLGLALVKGNLSADEAFALSQVDETYQLELWGTDPGAAAARDALRNDIAAARQFIDLYLR